MPSPMPRRCASAWRCRACRARRSSALAWPVRGPVSRRSRWADRLLLGGAAGIVVAGFLIAMIGRLSDDVADTAIAVVVTSLFGLGVLMALSPESPPGIQALLFGNPLGVSESELVTTGLLGAAVIGVLWLGHDRLLAIGFDGGSGLTIGVSSSLVRTLLLVLVAATVLIGVQGLGNLLVAAILVGPAAASRLLTSRMAPMIGLSVGIAVLSGFAGLYLSFHARIAAGAAIVACLLFSYLAAALPKDAKIWQVAGSARQDLGLTPESHAVALIELKDGRRVAVFQSPAPILDFFSVQSARYAVAEEMVFVLQDAAVVHARVLKEGC